MAEGGGCRDERRGSSASEVGTDDGTAKTKQQKSPSLSSLQSAHAVDETVVLSVSLLASRC